MDNSAKDDVSHHSEVSLLDFFALFWKGKSVIFIITILSAVISIFVALDSDEFYRSNALLEFNEKSPLASQGVSSMLGVASIKNSDHYTVDQAIAYLRSREVIYKFFQTYEVRKNLYPLAWDEAKDNWKDPSDIELSEWKVYTKYISSYLSIKANPLTKLVTISVRDQSPKNSALYITGLINITNAEARKQYLQKIDKKIKLLEVSLEDARNISTRDSLKTLLDEAIENKVWAQLNDEFLFKYIDYPVVPLQRSEPNRTLMTIIGTSSGLIISLILVLGLELLREREG